MITENMFDMAYVPNWKEQLSALQRMALPEPWRYKEPAFERKNVENHILEKYTSAIFRNQVLAHRNAQSPEEAQRCLCAQSGYICYHTGLLTHRYKPIYGFLERNRMPGRFDWVLRGFYDDAASMLRPVESLPAKPFSPIQQEQLGFRPNQEIRVNTDHILDDPDNLMRIPESIRDFPNLCLLLEAGVEMARRKAEYFPSTVAPQIFHGHLQYLLPISLTDPCRTDLAMTLTPMDGYYVGSTCLTLDGLQQCQAIGTPNSALADRAGGISPGILNDKP